MASTPDIILFTYDMSVFGRRMDWYLTLRGIKYSRCPVRNRLPREVLQSLNIQYRRIPILAIGRDIYCDTRLIISKLEQLFPENKLSASTSDGKATEWLLQNWTIDGGPFGRTAQLIPSSAPHMSDKAWIADRKEMSGRVFTKEIVDAGRPEALAHARMYFEFMEGVLENGRIFLLGEKGENGEERASLADIHAGWLFDWIVNDAYMRDALKVEGDTISEKTYPRTFAWIKRMRETVQKVQDKYGKPAECSAEETIQKILAAGFFEKDGEMDEKDPLKLRKGQVVEIWPIDSGFNHHDRGELVSIGVNEVVIASKPKVGDGVLRLHFPRTNFRIQGESKP
jgi:glutathione S-transferase